MDSVKYSLPRIFEEWNFTKSAETFNKESHGEATLPFSANLGNEWASVTPLIVLLPSLTPNEGFIFPNSEEWVFILFTETCIGKGRGRVVSKPRCHFQKTGGMDGLPRLPLLCFHLHWPQMNVTHAEHIQTGDWLPRDWRHKGDTEEASRDFEEGERGLRWYGGRCCSYPTSICSSGDACSWHHPA